MNTRSLLQDHGQTNGDTEAQHIQAEARDVSDPATNDATAPQARKTGIYHSDRAILGLALYALSSVFLATMLICAKRLKQHGFPVWQNLLARSLSIMTFALIACAKQRVNPFGNRYNTEFCNNVFTPAHSYAACSSLVIET